MAAARMIETMTSECGTRHQMSGGGAQNWLSISYADVVSLVGLVHRVGLVQPNNRDRPNRRDRPDRPTNGLRMLADFFNSLLTTTEIDPVATKYREACRTAHSAQH